MMEENTISQKPQRERIVVIGGGFAGLNLVKRLDKKRFDIVLVDRHNYHSFPPLFYQVASSGLDPGSISFPFRREMQKSKLKGTRFHMGQVKEINMERREVVTQFETLPFDKLVIAAGTTNNFFGNPDLVMYVYTIKSTPQALRCRYEILYRLERACLTKDMELRKKLLTFVVVGGGPTGVEVAGALGEMKREIIKKEYTTLKPEDVKIILLEGADHLLGPMSPHSQEKALQYLRDNLLVDVRLNTLLKDYVGNIATLSDGTTIDSGMVIWTAGITGVSFDIKGAPADFKLAPGNRFTVDRASRVVGLDGVFALGDITYMTSEDYPRGLPQLAQVAIQQAKLLADQINKDDYSREFHYVDKGSMATVGRNLAVADLKHVHLDGFLAWLTWMFIHLISLLGMRNKLTVLINWMWSYFSYATSLRLLFHTTRYPLRSRWGER